MNCYRRIVELPVKAIPRHWNADGRGKLIEGLRNDHADYKNDFGQAYITTILPGRIKAWHLHEFQTDRMMLIKGTVRFVGLTYDEFETYVKLDLIVSDLTPYLIVIPPKIWHGFQNIGTDEAYILNIPDKAYDHKHPDEERTIPRDARIKFSWEVSLDG